MNREVFIDPSSDTAYKKMSYLFPLLGPVASAGTLLQPDPFRVWD
jgi:hypothetical protein